MKRIALTKGKEALVDDQDYEYLMQWKWKASHNRNTFYANACTSRTYPGGRQYFSMHRLVAAQIGFPLGDKVDHVNRNGLDNQRNNLRPATNVQNSGNQKIHRTNTSGYRGVTWRKARGRWRAEIRIDGKLIELGSFNDPMEAAKAYNEAALKYFGEFAVLNPV
jgi:hypothetical protein